MIVAPTCFRDALRLLGPQREAGGLIGVSRLAVKTMVHRNYVPRPHWGHLTIALRSVCGLDVTRAEMEAWPCPFERIDQKPIAPSEWDALVKLEKQIGFIVRSKRYARELAEEAAGYAMLEMAERGIISLSYGVTCAFSYIVALRGHQKKHDGIDAIGVRPSVVTLPNQQISAELRDVLRAYERLPEKLKLCFQAAVLGHGDDWLGAALEVKPTSVRSYMSDMRKALREELAA